MIKRKEINRTIFIIYIIIISFKAHPQNFWEQVNGPYSGNIYTIAVDKSNGYMYCGTNDGGVFRSIDNGHQWEEINNGIQNYYIYSMIVGNDGTVFAGTPSTIYKSTDYGNSWQYCFYQFPGWIISLAINSKGDIFAGSNWGKVQRSTDNGNTWEEVYNDGYNWIYSIAIDSSDNIFIGTSNLGILASGTNGLSWEEKNNGFSIPVIRSININPTDGIIYVGANDGIYISTNSGELWNKIDSTLNDVSSINFLADGDLIANNYFSLWISEDRGFTANSITKYSDVETEGINTCVINSDDEIFVGNAGDGIYFSSDRGSSWSFSAYGITNVQFKTMLIDHADNIYVGTYYAGLSKSADGGMNFFRTNNGINYPFILSLACNLNNEIFAGSFGDGIYRSTNSGNERISVNIGLNNQAIHTIQIRNSGSILIGTEAGVYRSTNNGNSWYSRGLDNLQIACLAIDSSSNVLAGVYDYSNPDEINIYIYRSTDDGLTWQNIKELFDIKAIHIGENGNYYVASSGSVYYSYDEGVSWSHSALPHLVYSITSNKNSTVYAGTTNGIYTSNDFGVSWEELRSGLPLTVVNVSCSALDSRGYIYIGVSDHTMYKSKFSTTDVDNEANPSPSFNLYQNHPNPFNPSTKIKYSVSSNVKEETRNIVLKIFDILGNEIETLVNEEKSPGTYEINWNAGGLPSGVYFYQIKTGAFIETKKMVLLR